MYINNPPPSSFVSGSPAYTQGRVKGSGRVAIDIVPTSSATCVLFAYGTIRDPGSPANAAVSSGGPWTRDSSTGAIYPTTITDNVGIGATNPEQGKLHVNFGITSTGDGMNLASPSPTTQGPFIGINIPGTRTYGITIPQGTSRLSFVDTSGIPFMERMIITNTGNVGIGITDPPAHLTVRGANNDSNGGLRIDYAPNWNAGRNIYMSGGSLIFANGGNAAALDVSGKWLDGSDRSYKKEIKDMYKYGLTTVMKMRPREYKMKHDDIVQIGFIGQEMKALVPEVVSGQAGNLGIAYGQLVAVLAKTIQGLKIENDKKVKALSQENTTITEELAIIKQENSAIKQELSALKQAVAKLQGVAGR